MSKGTKKKKKVQLYIKKKTHTDAWVKGQL